MVSLGQPLEPLTVPGLELHAAVSELAERLEQAAAENDAAGAFARASVLRLRDARILAACAPQSDGGGGLVSLYDLAVAIGHIAEFDASVAIGASMHFGLSWYFGRWLRAGSPHAESREGQLARQWLAQIGRREMIVCSAVTEPGTEPWNPRTTATPGDGGWVIEGEKIAVSLSPVATHFYTRVRAETPHGPSQGTFMIPRDTAGVAVDDDWKGLGLRGSGSGRVTFSGVWLPQEAFLARGSWGVRSSDDAGRAANSILIVAVYWGIAEAARRLALSELRGRGGVRALQATASRAALAELEVALASARGVLHTALGHLDAQITHTAPRSHPEAAATALLADCVAAGMIIERAAAKSVDLAMRLCGAKSFAMGSPLARLYRDVRAAGFMRPYAPPEAWVDFMVKASLGGRDR